MPLEIGSQLSRFGGLNLFEGASTGSYALILIAALLPIAEGRLDYRRVTLLSRLFRCHQRPARPRNNNFIFKPTQYFIDRVIPLMLRNKAIVDAGRDVYV